MPSSQYHRDMHFGVLGPLVVRGPLGSIDVVGGKERLLLAHLLAAAGRLVTVDELADSMWGERPPRAPAKALQTYVLRLRNALEPDRRGVPTIVVTEDPGYRLVVRDHEVDALRFTQLAAAGRSALDGGRPAEAAATLQEALGLWRGAAYAGFEETPFGSVESQRLEELRVNAVEDRWAAEVDCGRAAAAVPELEHFVSQHPWRERAWATLVLALCRAGRQGDALSALARARSRLAEDLGVDPGPELQALQARVLAHDPELLRLPAVPGAGHPEVTTGLPGRKAYAEASALVRREAGTVAARGDALRGERAALADGLFKLQGESLPGDLPTGVCPWRGLSSYDVEDRAWFAGRERLVAELLARLAADRLVVVVGASGSGKSSLVRAGMLGALDAGALPGSSHWTTLLMRPGSAPMRELASVAFGAAHASSSLGDLLLRMAEEGEESDGEHRTVLVVDQLEEVWTECADERDRESFLDALAGIAHETDARVVLVVRGDYFAHLADHPGLAALTRDATLLVGAPTQAEVRRMVNVPARAAGLALDPGLAETISDEAGDEPGLLPLLSTSLMQLWERRDGVHLTYRDYVAIGGLAGAVAHLAEEAYEALPEADRAATRVVLLRLAGRTGGGDVVRRRVPLLELGGLPGNVVEVVAALTGARLLTLSGDAVEVAHESLFREWPRLAGWLADDESTRTVQHRLAVAAGQWDEQGRDPGLLWRGAGLEAALAVVATYPDETTAVEREFLADGEAALEVERRDAEERAAHRERQNRALRGLLTAASILLVLAVIAGAVAVASRRDTAEALDRQAAATVAAEARRLAAASLTEESLDLALLQAVEAIRTEAGPQTHGALLTLLARTPDLMHLRRGETPYLRAAASPDGRVVAVAEFDPRVVGLDAATGEEVWSRDVPDGGHVLSIDGGRRGFLVHAWNDARDTAVHLWDARTGVTRWSVTGEDLTTVVGRSGDPAPSAAVWDSRGRVVVLTPTHLVLLTADKRPLRAIELQDSPDPGWLLAWPDGRVSYEAPLDAGRGHVVDVSRPAEHRTLDFRIESVSPDGALVLTADRSRVDQVSLRLRDADSLRPVGEGMSVPSFDGGVDWSSHGETFAIGAGEIIQVRDRRGRLLRELSGAHSGAVMAPVLAGPDDQMLWAAGRDGLVSGWDLAGQQGLIRSSPLGTGPHSGQADVSGQLAAGTLFSFTGPNRPALLDVRAGRTTPLMLPSGCRCQMDSITITPDGDLAVGSVMTFDENGFFDPEVGRLMVWSTDDRTLQHDVALPWNPVAAAVSSDGSRALVNGGGGLAVVDLVTGDLVSDPVSLPRYDGFDRARSVAIRDDGTVAAVLREAGILLVDPVTGEVLERGSLGSSSTTAQEGTALAWVGENLVVGGLDGRLSFLDGETLEPVAPPREAAAGFVIDLLSVGPVLASLGSDGDVRLWDVRSWQPMGLPLTEEHSWGFLSGVPGELTAWFEGADGGEGRVRRLPLSPRAWVERACSLVSRQLTEDEWAVIHPERQWRETCSDA
jgi:DNA-binding SARP family transcriptional activator/WD40 repeat protein